MSNETHIPQDLLAKLNAIKNLKDGAEAVGSIEEAANAADKFYRLLMKHNLTEEQVMTEGVKAKIHMLVDVVSIMDVWKYNSGNWARLLVNTIGDFCLCFVVGINNGAAVTILGEKQNVATAMYIIEQLISKIHIAFKLAWVEYKPVATVTETVFRNSFLTGAVTAIRVKLNKDKEQMAKENTEMGVMVLSKKEAAERFAMTKFGGLVSSRNRAGKVSSGEGYAQGYKAGKGMEINKGLGGNSTKRLE